MHDLSFFTVALKLNFTQEEERNLIHFFGYYLQMPKKASQSILI